MASHPLAIIFSLTLLISFLDGIKPLNNQQEESPFDIISSRKSGFEMVNVEGGSFTMGGEDEVNDGGTPEMRIADECPHLVNVSDFSIGKYEVTQADWYEVMGTNLSDMDGCDDCPVEQVSWNDIQEFINKANKKFNQTYRLPSEAEWEFAAKGGTKSKDFLYAGSNNAEEVSWFIKNSGNSVHPVGILLPNELGIYDMSGNIWEWCSDEKRPYPCDQIGRIFNSKVLRGGSFSHRVSSVRLNDRNARDPSMRLPTLGFRLAI
ncbi:MAG: formylglycine-generating enzyme family protein [Bacteroidota bacterium]